MTAFLFECVFINLVDVNSGLHTPANVYIGSECGLSMAISTAIRLSQTP